DLSPRRRRLLWFDLRTCGFPTGISPIPYRVALPLSPATGSAASMLATTTRRPPQCATPQAGARRSQPVCALRPTDASLRSTATWRPEVEGGDGSSNDGGLVLELGESLGLSSPSLRTREDQGNESEWESGCGHDHPSDRAELR